MDDIVTAAPDAATPEAASDGAGSEPADGFRLRLLTPADEPALRAIHARQVKYTGFDYAWPELFRDPRYYRVFVAERAGVVEGCLVAHATTEIFVIADRPRVLRALVRRQQKLEACLRRAGADELHAFVPRSLVGRMKQFLERMSMRASSSRCVTFYRELKGE